MKADLLNLRVLLVIGGLVAVISYIVTRVRLRKKVDTTGVLEVVFSGAGFLGGIHLILCALFPDQLVHLLSEQGTIPDGVRLEMSEWHAVEILAGGAALAVVSVNQFLLACRR